MDEDFVTAEYLKERGHIHGFIEITELVGASMECLHSKGLKLFTDNGKVISSQRVLHDKEGLITEFQDVEFMSRKDYENGTIKRS